MLKNMHPINALESRLGSALPVAGMLTGGAAGTIAAGPEPMAPAAAMAGAGVGAGIGEAARVAAGRRMGMYQGPSADDIAAKSLGAATTEGGGQVLNAIPIPIGNGDYSNIPELAGNAAQMLLNGGKKVITKVGSVLTQTPQDAMLRTIERPNQILNPPDALDTASAANAEIEATKKNASAKVGKAYENFLKQKGGELTPTDDLLGRNAEFQQENIPNAQGEATVRPDEASYLNQKALADFTTPEFSATPLPNAVSTKPLFDKGAPTVIDPGVPYTPVKPQIVRAGETEQTMTPISPTMSVGKPVIQNIYPEKSYEPIPVPVSTVERGWLPGEPVEHTPVSLQFAPEDQTYVPGKEPITVSPLEGYENQMPLQTWGSLRKTSQDITNNEVGTAYDKDGLLQRTDAGTNQQKRLDGMIRGKFKEADPDILRESQNASQVSDDLENIKPLRNDPTAESFINNIFKKNKSAQQQSMENLAPETYNGPIKDIAADNAYNDTPTRLGVSVGQMGRAGAGALVGQQAYAHGADPAAAAALGLSTAVVTDPRVWKAGLGYGSKMVSPWTGLATDNIEQATPAVINQLQNRNPWSLGQEEDAQ